MFLYIVTFKTSIQAYNSASFLVNEGVIHACKDSGGGRYIRLGGGGGGSKSGDN